MHHKTLKSDTLTSPWQSTFYTAIKPIRTANETQPYHEQRIVTWTPTIKLQETKFRQKTLKNQPYHMAIKISIRNSSYPKKNMKKTEP
jgi:hypothetical protein